VHHSLDGPRRRNFIMHSICRVAIATALLGALVTLHATADRPSDGSPESTSASGLPAATSPDKNLSPAAISGMLPPLPTTDRGWRVPLGVDRPFAWTPIRDEVNVTVPQEANADRLVDATLRIEYGRTPQTAGGVAVILPAGACADLDMLVVRMSATPAQRLFVSLTDRDGIVWTFPTFRASAEVTKFELSIDDLKPDAFQNRGKSVPATVDLEAIVMLTIVDISGYMGAPAVDCAWSIASVEGVRR